MKRLKHGMTGTKIYMVWKELRARCERITHRHYKNYGERGIAVCEEWSSFIVFKDWAMANGYVEGLSIDRVDNNKGYHPENCQWITRSENSGKDNVGELHWASRLSAIEVLEMRRLYAAGGITHKEIAKLFGMSQSHVTGIINKKKWGHI